MNDVTRSFVYSKITREFYVYFFFHVALSLFCVSGHSICSIEGLREG